MLLIDKFLAFEEDVFEEDFLCGNRVEVDCSLDEFLYLLFLVLSATEVSEFLRNVLSVYQEERRGGRDL